MTIRSIAAALALVATTVATPALAAKSPEELCKGGQLANVRINTLKAPESRATYEKAAKDHIGWYRKRGQTTNRLLTGPVLLYDRATGEWSQSPSEIASLHLQSPGVPAAQRDAEWDAYVAAYRASSDLSVDKFVCLQEPVK